MESSTEFADMEAVAKKARDTRKVLVVYKGNVLDLTHFYKNHPGGGEIIAARSGKAIESSYHGSHQHSAEAMTKLLSYKIGKVKNL